ncbi:MAG: carboxymuconolactone decarboxylase family protein [Methanomassiliicoccales archaeon]|nr:carboxymuconolactone decarboxylase family protein [Methanomassiliicoccales archaeon]
MDERTKELVAIGASVAGHCQPCLRHHMAKAKELGISEDDVNAAIRLAKVISENGDKRMMEFTEGLMNELALRPATDLAFMKKGDG